MPRYSSSVVMRGIDGGSSAARASCSPEVGWKRSRSPKYATSARRSNERAISSADAVS
jgi:hypothetical protein